MKSLYSSILAGALVAASAQYSSHGQDSPSSGALRSEPLANEPLAQQQNNVEKLIDELKQSDSKDAQRLLGWLEVPRRSPSEESVLAVRFESIDPREGANLEADLAVMSRLLRNVLKEKFGSAHSYGKVLGVDVAYVPGAQPIRTMYLEGYGALFLLNVGFPLHAAPAEPADAKQKRKTDSAWEQATRDYYGEPSPDKLSNTYAQAYDEQKVSALKAALIEGLKSASNIRGLNAKDSVTICVSGSASISAVPVPRLPGQNAFEPGARPSQSPDAITQRSFLTLRATKSDIDGFASGKISAEEFSRTVKLTTYLGPAGRWSAPGAPYTTMAPGATMAP
ncbi:MAG: hypothetical protein C5B50_09440 [Verrucomicrobia bacterium]|nr:MAG: hypothetical protein C5B50_09440 [Verrucomicrobiota bacterium]